MQKQITIMIATAYLAAAQRGTLDVDHNQPISHEDAYYRESILKKAEKCVQATRVYEVDPEDVSDQFTVPSGRGRGENSMDNEDLDTATRCVRNMIAFENRHCEMDDGIVDPEICLHYQIEKLLQAEADEERLIEPDFNTDEYLEMPAAWKQQKIWERVIEDDESMPFIDGEEIADFFTNDMNLTFDHLGDQMPEGRQKLVHPKGVVAKVAFIPQPNTMYTGMFKEAQEGVMRISDAMDVDPTLANHSSPSVGLKFLRDGMHAADTIGMVAQQGVPTFNLLKHRLSTQLPGTDDMCFLETFGKKIAEATDHLGTMSVMDWGLYDKHGNEEVDPVWPFRLDFEGINNYGWTDEFQENFTEQFKKVEAGSVMFNVYAYESPIHKLTDPDGQLIGKIVSTSEFVTSHWGDKKLFFRHSRIEDDLETKHEWDDFLSPWPFGTLEEDGLTMPPPVDSSCPFFFLWESLIN